MSKFKMFPRNISYNDKAAQLIDYQLVIQLKTNHQSLKTIYVHYPTSRAEICSYNYLFRSELLR